MQDKQQRHMGSVRHIAHRILRVASRCIAGVALPVTGIANTIAGATTIIIDHVAFVRRDYHPVVVGSAGPNKRIHVILHPLRQVAPDGLRHRGDGGVKVEVGVGVLKMAEDARKHAPKQATTPLLNKLMSSLERFSRRVTTLVKKRR